MIQIIQTEAAVGVHPQRRIDSGVVNLSEEVHWLAQATAPRVCITCLPVEAISTREQPLLTGDLLEEPADLTRRQPTARRCWTWTGSRGVPLLPYARLHTLPGGGGAAPWLPTSSACLGRAGAVGRAALNLVAASCSFLCILFLKLAGAGDQPAWANEPHSRQARPELLAAGGRSSNGN